MRTFILILFLPMFCLAQIDKAVTAGILINGLDQRIAFRDLKWSNGKAEYINVSTHQLESLYENSIKSLRSFTDDDPEFAKKEEITEEQTALNGMYRTSLPEGVYLTMEDFIQGKPNSTAPITPRELYGFEKNIAPDGAMYCFFFDHAERKISKAFAVVHKNYLYFRMGSVLKNKNKKDKSQGSDNPNAFSRVIIGGNNYLYTEAPLGNIWEKGLYANYGVSTAMANHNKGILWDRHNSEFNIFVNCKDYNTFMQQKAPEHMQECKDKQPNNFLIREAVLLIK